MADAESRRAKRSRGVVPEKPWHDLRSEPAAGSLSGIRGSRQQSRRLHEQHAGVARRNAHRARMGSGDFLLSSPDGALSHAYFYTAVRRADLLEYSSADGALAQRDGH